MSDRIQNATTLENANGDEETCSVLDIGEIRISEVNILMERLTELRLHDRIPDMLLIMNHPASLAVGARPFNPDDLAKPQIYFEQQGIYLFKSIRGGGLTYHWDGQLVCYPILKLNPHEQNLSNYMYRLEEVGIRTLKDYGVTASRRRDETAQIGLWHKGKKIASTGVHISRWVTSFGFALNLTGNIEPSLYIRPCGLKDVCLTTIAEATGNEPDRAAVKSSVIRHFQDVFHRRINISSNGRDELKYMTLLEKEGRNTLDSMLNSPVKINNR
ncbi:lipoyl(octanoyl) transferase LipB [candidate division KSB1 bacterium]|nr:lipoyl(octanoyl) transferase LipB [candidate division KSB1 bacterium]